MNDEVLKNYIGSLTEKEIRMDGRKFDEFRKPIKIELNISNQAEGSAKVSIGNTQVMVGIKLGVSEPYPDSPDKGNLITGAELLALSSPEFESGPPDAQTTELARIIDRGIRESRMIDLEKLCIKKGELVWMVFIDAYTLNDDGNLIDAAALAAVAALKNTVFPKLEKDKVVFGEHTKTKLPLKKVPITCTLVKIRDKILVDPNSKEEKVSDSRLSIAVSEDGKINAMQKGGDKSLKIEDIDKMIDIAIEKTKELRKILNK